MTLLARSSLDVDILVLLVWILVDAIDAISALDAIDTCVFLPVFGGEKLEPRPARRCLGADAAEELWSPDLQPNSCYRGSPTFY